MVGIWWGNLRGRDHWEESNLDRSIILRWTFRKSYVGAWIGLSWLIIRRHGENL